jgi:hypothetical protein
MNDNLKLACIRVDKELWRRMKLRSYIEGVTIQSWIAMAIEKSLDEKREDGQDSAG